jgi:hypothetical protein
MLQHMWPCQPIACCATCAALTAYQVPQCALGVSIQAVDQAVYIAGNDGAQQQQCLRSLGSQLPASHTKKQQTE